MDVEKMDLTDEVLEKMRDGTWVPPIKKLPEHPTHEVLLKHHEAETRILFTIIRRLASVVLLSERARRP